LGLENTRALLEFLGRPERKFKSIHIAGTNGKGSVAAMLAAVHQKSGRKTGLYTSPHLVAFGERIRIDGTMISEAEVVEFLERVWPMVEELKSTFFEVTTALAFDHFARHRVDIAIIETGLGGRLDATNVLEAPLATVVTSIGHDHHAQLGPTLEAIAREKAGIFKQGVPSIVSCHQELKPIFTECAAKAKGPLFFVPEIANLPRPYGTIPFPGAHQWQNVLTVQTTLAALPYQFSESTIEQGIAEASLLTGLRGRLEEIQHPALKEQGIRLFLDVGHNPEALMAVRDFFQEEINVKPVVIFGIMRDKEVDTVLRHIASFASITIAVAAGTARSLPSSELTARAQEMGISAVDGGSILKGFELALHSPENSIILLAGSHYVVGEFLAELSLGILGF
ncbi:MAG TPA: Mur ligase family protein, partial [Candidatus Kapabacteria bacterium]